MDVMKAWIEGRTDRPSFTQPDNVVVLAVDRASGSAVAADAPGAIPEVFISGTQPGGAFRTPQ
jgi:membrane carboxypeptidase/penicillin-binding protein